MSEPEMVYVVVEGERGEGGEVISVHRDLIPAARVALAVKTHFPGGWIPSDSVAMRWDNGCDYVQLERRELLP